jgi:hypothetical protein
MITLLVLRGPSVVRDFLAENFSSQKPRTREGILYQNADPLPPPPPPPLHSGGGRCATASPGLMLITNHTTDE